MSISRIVTVALLSAGLVACSEDGSVQPEKQTEITVTIDKNPATEFKTAEVARISPSSIHHGLQLSTIDQIVYNAMALVIPGAHAAPVPGASIFLVYINQNKVVTEVLTDKDGLTVEDLGNGTYKVIMPTDLRVDGMIVTGFNGVQPEKGLQLPSGAFYAPAVGEEVVLSEGSTAATRLTYSFINSFGGLSAQDLKRIIDNVTNFANQEVFSLVKDGKLTLDNLQSRLDQSIGPLIQNELLSGKSQLLADATSYIGEYKSFAHAHYFSTAADGKAVQLLTGLMSRTTQLSAVTPAEGATVNKALLGVKQTTSSGFANQQEITAALGWNGHGYTALNHPELTSTTGVTNLGKMLFSFDAYNFTPSPAKPTGGADTATGKTYSVAKLSQATLASTESIGVAITSGLSEKSVQKESGDRVVLEAYVSSPELLFLKPASHTIDSVSGKYGAVYHLRDFAQSPYSVKRGLEKFDAANGTLSSSLLFNTNQMTMPTGKVPVNSYVKESIGNATFQKSAEEGSLNGKYGTHETKTLVDKQSRILHSQIGTSPSGKAGYVTAVKLPTQATIDTVKGKVFQVVGSEALLKYASIGAGEIKGLLSFAGPQQEYFISLTSDALVSYYDKIELGSAKTTADAEAKVLAIKNLAVSAEGVIEFLSSDDRGYKGFVQAGGDLIILHSDFAYGNGSEDPNYKLSDYILYAVCTAGCSYKPPVSIGGSVSGLSGTLVLSLNGSQSLSITANGGFTFADKIKGATNYTVTVATQPSGQTCTVTNGTGTASANVTNVAVSCAATPAPAS